MRSTCEQCDASPALLIESRWQLGLIVFRKEFRTTLVLCRSHAQSQTVTDLILTTLFGWWGVISFITNIVLVPLQISEVVKAWKIPPSDSSPVLPGAHRRTILTASNKRALMPALGVLGVLGLGLVLVNMMSTPASYPPVSSATVSAADGGNTSPYVSGTVSPAPVESTGPATDCNQDCLYTGTGVDAVAVASQAIVQQYFDAINRRDYRTAWALGGSNLGHDYQQFVAGFSTTTQDAWTVNETSAGGTEVYGQLIATRADGTTATYEGHYVVTGESIVSGQLTRQ